MYNRADSEGNIWIYNNQGGLIAFQGKYAPVCAEMQFQLEALAAS